jgi:hypothetical protein
MFLRRWLLGLLRKHTACKAGNHGDRFDANGQPANFCGWCGHTFNSEAFKPWIVTLRTGEQFEVNAINEYHAGSMVVYGDSTQIDGRTSAVLGSVKVHRGNIVSAVLKQDQGPLQRIETQSIG